MGFLDRLFGKPDSAQPGTPTPASAPAVPLPPATRTPDPQLRFGHYVDANKTPQQLAKWEEANSLYQQKNYRDSFVAFLEYICDPAEKNVTWAYKGPDLHFSLEQGSKVVRGVHNGESVSAYALLAAFEQPPIAVMRQLLASNYLLRYTKFAIQDNKFGIYFKSQAREASPNKLYHSFKELALKADKNDDFLVEEFTGILKTDLDHIPQPDARIGEIKYAYWTKWTEETLAFVNSVDRNSFAGIISYAVLNLFYKTDYLLAPQGHFLDEITRIQHIYWNKQDSRPNVEKNDDMLRNLKLLLMKQKTYFTDAFYTVKATFGLAPGTGSQAIADYITDCLKNTDWYVQNRHPNMEMIIYEYTSTYCLFHYGMYPAHYKLLNMHLQILDEAYFRELGFAVPYVKDGVIQQQAVLAEINRIMAEEKATFKDIAFVTANLKFGSVYEFHYSFLSELRFLNFAK